MAHFVCVLINKVCLKISYQLIIEVWKSVQRGDRKIKCRTENESDKVGQRHNLNFLDLRNWNGRSLCHWWLFLCLFRFYSDIRFWSFIGKMSYAYNPLGLCAFLPVIPGNPGSVRCGHLSWNGLQVGHVIGQSLSQILFQNTPACLAGRTDCKL